MARLDEEYVRKATTLGILLVLIFLSFLIIKPIILSIVGGIILAFIFSPVYDFLLKYTKSKNLSASLICTLLILLIVLPIWFLLPIFIEQSFRIFQASHSLPIIETLKSVFPSFFASESFSNEVGKVIESFISRTTNSITNSLTNLVLNFPIIMLHFLVVFFTLYFVLRDKEEIINYIKSLSPLTKDTENKLFDYTKGITSSVIYGHIIVGIIQGLIAGTGFIIFGVPNALYLTLIAIVVGILPIVGPLLVWMPVAIYMLADGNNVAAIGVIIFGIISSTVDNFLRPLIVSRRTRLSTSIVVIGMIGGFFMFGILGFIIGPLILAYLLIILELYRKKEIPGIFIQEDK